MECGARLQRQSIATSQLAPPELGTGSGSDPSGGLPALPAAAAHPMFDPVTGQLLAQPASAAADDDATNVLPALGEPQNTYGSGQSFAPPSPHAQGPGHWDGNAGEYATPWPEPPRLDAPSYGYDDQANLPTRQQYVNQPPYRQDPYASGQYTPRYGGTTGVLPETYAPWEGQWQDEEPVEYGRTFRIRPLLLLSLIPAAAAIVAMFAQVIDIAPAGPLPFGPSKLNDFGTNQTVTGALVAVAMVLGGLAWCGGFRWGAGLAGGAGAGLAGWAGLVIGLVEIRIDQARTINPGAEDTRDIGFWCLAGAGAFGLLVMFTSLARAGNDRRAGLDPWVAALGAIATIAAVLGPLIPLNDASLDENWSSPAGVDFPTVYFIARFAQLGLLLTCGVFGFLLVRRFGLGFAIGGTIGVAWMVLTTATEQTDAPVGPAVGNPGATDFKPYIVTTVGVGLMIFFALVATAMALIDAD
jgi:hypothetical protein